ncbi:MAG: phenylalanine--tRNA ligase subunit beta, partial [Blastocatellia bacterium]
MNISYNWLKELIDIGLSAEETAAALTRVGLAVEGVHPHGDDFVLDIDLTSNRPDCLSHLGIAREIGVITGGQVMLEQRRNENRVADAPFPSLLAPEIVRIEAPELCHRFTARIIRNVKIVPSPDWLVKRLEAIGERAINNVADITNYVMHELGQPMHSFDLDKLAENRIVVRNSRSGETVKTLDEIERKLDESMLVICDAEKPVAVAGVMGGLETGITESTTNVLLEVACFKRERVRSTSRILGLATEASYRFERGVDIENLKAASDRATKLICELAGGEAGEYVDVYPARFEAKEVESGDISAAVKRLTGLILDTAECVRILDALGVSKVRKSEISDLGSKSFAVPSWRHDISIEADLVEEVARHAGYENIADELPPAYGAGEYQATEARKKLLRQALVDQGFDEAISYSFIDTKFDEIYEIVPGILDGNIESKFVELRDAVIEGAVRMRPTLLPGLLEAVRLNFNYQNRNLKLFEIGKVFAAKSGEDGLPTERELFAIAVTGGELRADRAMPARDLDFYDAKGAAESAMEAVGFSGLAFEADNARHLRKGQSASISLHGKSVGMIGRLNEEISAHYKFKQPVYVAEIDLQTVLAETTEPVFYTALPKYPSIIRDVSFTVGRDVTFSKIRRTIIEKGIELCKSVDFVDIYEDKGLGENERSLTIRLEYRSDQGTLV